MRYWDSSAIVPLLVDERSSTTKLRRAFRADDQIATWLLTAVEVAGSLWRMSRADRLGVEALRLALEGLDELEPTWTLVVDADQVQRRARRLLAVHPLRSADALQLASALVLTDDRPKLAVFVTLDDRLADVARREGFRVEP